MIFRPVRFALLASYTYLLPLVGSCWAQFPAASIGGGGAAFRKEGGYGVMTNDGMVQLLRTMAPRFVDPTGRTPGTTPGLVVGFVTESGSKVVAFGTKVVGSDKAPDGDTKFGIGSVTKIFTGIVLAKAVSDGVVRLDDSANRYLPANLKLPTDKITLRHLVTHTSGLPNFPENLRAFRDLDKDGKNDSEAGNPARNYTREMLADSLKRVGGPTSAPGASAQYSNLGIGLLSVLLQGPLGFKSFQTMNEAVIAGPLGMSSTSTNPDAVRAKGFRNLAQGYSFGQAGLVPAPLSNMGVLDGAGELVSSANDLLRLLQAATGLAKTQLAPAFQEATKPLAPVGDDDMGYAIRIKHSQKGGVFYGKAGETAGYSAMIIWRKEPKIGVILLANSGDFKQVSHLGAEIIEAAIRH